MAMAEARGSTGRLWGLLVGGVLLLFAGGLATLVAWSGDLSTAGEATTAMILFGFAGLGALMTMVAIVGFGVYLGHQAHGVTRT